MEKLVHVYHGDGKGKTTAAIGLTVRASGCGRRVIFSQFMKGQRTGELAVLNNISNVKVIRSEKDFPFYSRMTDEQKVELATIHNSILKELIAAVDAEAVDMIVMDEITYPYSWGLMDSELFNELMTKAKGQVELVLTGRNPDELMLAAADYITEMKCIRHPYEKGIKAREGIEF